MNSFQSSLQLQTLVVRVLKDFITQRYESLGWVTVLSGNPFVPPVRVSPQTTLASCLIQTKGKFTIRGSKPASQPNDV